MTHTDTTTAQFIVTYEGEGNWEVEAPNGTWTITADTADEAKIATDRGVAYFLEGPNHHLAEFWASSLDEAQEIVRTYGVDRRTTRSARTAA